MHGGRVGDELRVKLIIIFSTSLTYLTAWHFLTWLPGIFNS